MAFVSQRERVNSDAAIGIFLVATLAWGMLALKLYDRHRPGSALDWQGYLFGDLALVSRSTMICGLCAAAIVALTLGMFAKEIIACAFDPLMARVSGVRVALVHYMLMALLALTIVIGMRIAGSVLMTALLILPGATALLLARDLRLVVTVSAAVGLIGSVGGLMLTRHVWPYVPSGSAIVLTLFGEFIIAYAFVRLTGKPA
jgi:ABC-type Mn2+/Zn2+ transport system permease subunit